MSDVSNFRPGNKETAIACLVVFALLLVAGGVGYMLGLRNAAKDGGGVPDNGNGIDDVREQYHHIEVNQQQITDGLAGAVGRSDDAAQTAGRIEERAGEAARSVADAGVILDECQQIIGSVRNRGQAGADKD